MRSIFVCCLVLCIGGLTMQVKARPSRAVPFFPQYTPWDIGNIGIHAEESSWNPHPFPDDLSPQLGKYFYSFDSSDKQLKDRSSIRNDIQPSVPVYEKGRGGFVPPSTSALDKTYWWDDKRFNNFNIPTSEDLPYVATDEDYDDEYETNVPGTVKKRDYTAAQLVNMLKALAKARRQRNVRIAGKGLRFGISR